MRSNIIFFTYLALLHLVIGQTVEPAVRVVRFQVEYPNADIIQVGRLQNWAGIMRKSVLASLKFVNKHWTICGQSERLEKALG